MARGVLAVAMEDIVRPFVTAFSPPINRVPPQVPVEAPVATISWGQPGTITVPSPPPAETIGDHEWPIEQGELLGPPFDGMTPDELADYLNTTGLTLEDIQREIGESFALFAELYKPEQPAQDPVLQEVSRVTSTVRVSNPNDALQYVDVERIDLITFQGDSGRLTLKFNNPL